MLDWLSRRFGRCAIPHLGLLIVLAQGLVYVASLTTRPDIVSVLSLDLQRVLAGELWRLVTFVFVPPASHPVFLFFALYFFWLMASSLEGQWGAFRFTVYMAVGWAMTILASVGMALIDPRLITADPGNGLLLGSVFLAFAWLWPNFQILLFFIIPVKIKYLALLTWLGYLLVLCLGSWLQRGLVLAAIANFLLFFGADIARRMWTGHRRMVAKIGEVADEQAPFHRCVVCGVTEKTDPSVHYRTCGECRPAREYCMAHLKGHEHVVAQPDVPR